MTSIWCTQGNVDSYAFRHHINGAHLTHIENSIRISFSKAKSVAIERLPNEDNEQVIVFQATVHFGGPEVEPHIIKFRRYDLVDGPTHL